MKVKNATISTMHDALKLVNKQYDNNIIFKRIEPTGRQITFTLTVISSSKSGHRLGLQTNKDGTRRKLSAACWHVHGDFFEALLKLNSNAVIRSSGPDGPIVIDINGGNWVDRNIGSQMEPMYYSEACDC